MKPFTIFDPLPRGVKRDPYKHLRCTHHHHNLRACWLPRGHSGRHDNPNLRQFQGEFTSWEDSDGYYIHSREDWQAHVGRLIDRGRAGEGGNQNSLERSLERAGEVYRHLQTN